jgi:hypothetical protein
MFYAAAKCWRTAPGKVFPKAQIEQAGLTQPWLVKLHTELGMPLCKSEAEFYTRMRAMPVGGVMTLAIMLQGTASDVGKSVLVAGLSHPVSGWIKTAPLNRRIWRLTRVLPRRPGDGARANFSGRGRGLCRMCA